jgi:hypothetical protein
MKRKFDFLYNDGGDFRLIDKKNPGTADVQRVVKLKAAKRKPWTEAYQGKELGRLEDDGNGLYWKRPGRDTIRIPYDEAAELFLLLSHLAEDPRYFGKPQKVEKARKGDDDTEGAA